MLIYTAVNWTKGVECVKGSMFGYPSTCEYRGVIHSCTLSLACWLVGGTLTAGCGGDVLADWLFTCCVTAHPVRPQPQRRWGLHRQSQVGKLTQTLQLSPNTILYTMVLFRRILQSRQKLMGFKTVSLATWASMIDPNDWLNKPAVRR